MSAPPKIVLTGTTGGLGSQVLKHILDLVPHSSLTLAVSSPDRTPSLPPNSQARVVHADFTRPETLAPAFAGQDRLLIVSYPGIAHQQRVDAHRNAIEAAKAAGVPHVFYTSLAFASDSSAAVMQAHLDTERYLQRSGLTYTIVREGIYQESWPLYLGFWTPDKGSDVLVPGTGAIAWASREDLGEATARLIAQGGHPNETILLTGSSAPTFAETASLLSSLLHRPLSVRTVSVDEYVTANKNRSREEDAKNVRGSEPFLRQWATTYTALERGELAVVDPSLQSILGRQPRSMEAFLRQSISASGESEAVGRYAK